MKKDIENKLINKNTKPTSMRILVYDFLSSQETALSLSEIEIILKMQTAQPFTEP